MEVELVGLKRSMAVERMRKLKEGKADKTLMKELRRPGSSPSA